MTGEKCKLSGKHLQKRLSYLATAAATLALGPTEISWPRETMMFTWLATCRISTSAVVWQP